MTPQSSPWNSCSSSSYGDGGRTNSLLSRALVEPNAEKELYSRENAEKKQKEEKERKEKDKQKARAKEEKQREEEEKEKARQEKARQKEKEKARQEKARQKEKEKQADEPAKMPNVPVGTLHPCSARPPLFSSLRAHFSLSSRCLSLPIGPPQKAFQGGCLSESSSS